MSNFKVFVGDNNNQAKYVGQIPDDATIAKINNAASLPDQTGNSGKFLTTDGTNTSWSGAPLGNTATGVDSVGIKGVSTGNYQVIIGNGARGGNAVGSVIIGDSTGSIYNSINSVFIGRCAGPNANVNCSVGIGPNAKTSADGAIQLSTSVLPANNSDANTFKVANQNGNFEIMSADGTIPEARLADMTNATTGQVLQLDSNNNANWSTISEVASQNSGTIKFWTGTQVQYDAITIKDATTLYIVIPAS